MEMLFKSAYAWRLNLQCFLFLNTEQEWQNPCSSSEEMKAPHPDKQDGWKNMWMKNTFLILLQRTDSSGCFTVVDNSSKHEPQRGHHPPTGYGRRDWPREAWLMQGHPGVCRLNKSWTSTLPMSGLGFTRSFTSSLKDMTKGYKTKDLHCPSQPI